jgi:hypothetical protein
MINVDCDFPGGNVVLDSIEGDTISVHQDLRDTEGDWFYWYFRVQGASGRMLTVHFTESNVIGVRGPAVSLNEGETWAWVGAGAVDGQSFMYQVPADVESVRFCFAMPYLDGDLNAFLERHADHPNLKREVLCKTRAGREAELLHLGRLDGASDHRVLLTCRHHCCEMMASYSLEGMMETVLTDQDFGAWLRDHVEFAVVPFVDKDGVENGDQGKNRRPHDHNRDYSGESIYSTVRTIRQWVPEWSGGQLRLGLDMHCPWIRGEHNENIYFPGGPDEENWKRVSHFGEILERVQTGPLIFDTRHNLPFGEAWNTADNFTAGKSFGRWASELPGISLGGSIEIPYANAGGQPVTAQSARALGRDLARTLYEFLREAEREEL